MWKLKILFTAVTLSERRQEADDTASGTDYVNECEEILLFWSQRGLERYLKNHPQIEVLERHNDQRFVIGRDAKIRS